VTFPVLIRVGPWAVPPHPVFELGGYAIAVVVFLWLRRRYGDPIDRTPRWSVAAAAVIGGALGSRLLAWPDGKTIVGGLLGGLIAVELTKKRLGVTTATGDLFAIPIAVGVAIGRVGCFLTGLPDNTYGNPTSFWSGVDFGDGIPRHPTQLYETAFLAGLAALLAQARPRLTRPGDVFRLFMIVYLLFRLLLDFIKPTRPLALGLSAIQFACLAGLAYYAHDTGRLGRALLRPSHAP
jgi:phosphatidylglycerol:prolipoprotein diacylglycerol transferase